jgi:hypothetical protein
MFTFQHFPHVRHEAFCTLGSVCMYLHMYVCMYVRTVEYAAKNVIGPRTLFVIATARSIIH